MHLGNIVLFECQTSKLTFHSSSLSTYYYDTENVQLSVNILLFSCILCYTGLWWRHVNQVLHSSLNGCGQHWFLEWEIYLILQEGTQNSCVVIDHSKQLTAHEDKTMRSYPAHKMVEDSKNLTENLGRYRPGRWQESGEENCEGSWPVNWRSSTCCQKTVLFWRGGDCYS